MTDHSFIAEYLNTYYDQLTPREFYRGIFPVGELAEAGKQEEGKYTAIAVELADKIKRYTITDDLNMIDQLLESENFIIISPISYAGKSRVSQNARFLYAMAIDLDGVDDLQNIRDLFQQINVAEYLPRPTYMVASGNGIHLYYQFERPIPCFKNITHQLARLKQALTKKIWNKYVTTQYEQPQFQSLFQGFRMAGGVTKQHTHEQNYVTDDAHADTRTQSHTRTQAFLIGEPVTVEYLNEFILPEDRVTDITYKSKLTLAEAKKKYPDWYEERIVKKHQKGTWVTKRDLYDWWKKRIMYEASVGHRYFCIMCLAIYGKKAGIDYDEVQKDAFELVERMDRLTTTPDNHFTREDVLTALEMYNDNYFTFPIHSIVEVTNIPIERNKRNFQKQADHLEEARAIRDIRQRRKGRDWRNKDGRPSKEAVVEQWQKEHPDGSKADCIRETGLSKPTVYRHWKSPVPSHPEKQIDP